MTRPVLAGGGWVRITAVDYGFRDVRLVISDHHDGLKAAIARCFGGAGSRRCRVHAMRNVLAKVPKDDPEMVAAAIRTIFAQPSAEASIPSSTARANVYAACPPMAPDSSAPLLSVVVCTYNRAQLLPAALESVLTQGYARFELVVVDDGSTDGTAELIAGIADPRLRYVRQENQGLSVARNTGVAAATGRYVVFLDDDDRALPGWLEHLVDQLDGECAAACCGEILAEDDGRFVRSVMPHPLGPRFCDYWGWFLPGTFAVRRDLYEAVGGFTPGLEHLHHTEFALRLLPECRARGLEIRVIDEALVERHVGGDRRTSLSNVGKIQRSVEYLLARHGELLARDDWILAQFSAIAGVGAAQLGDFRTARRLPHGPAAPVPCRGSTTDRPEALVEARPRLVPAGGAPGVGARHLGRWFSTQLSHQSALSSNTMHERRAGTARKCSARQRTILASSTLHPKRRGSMCRADRTVKPSDARSAAISANAHSRTWWGFRGGPSCG